METTERLISMRQLPDITGYSRRKILDMVSKDEFPQPIRMNARCNRWRLSTVMQWINDVEATAQGNDIPHVCNNPIN
jgi:predicted DNA-binding transcriptional regulator AlpA